MTDLRAFCLFALCLAASAVAQEIAPAEKIELRSGRLLSKVTEGGRIPLYRDRLQYALLSQNEWPVDLDAVWEAAKVKDDATWQPLEADENGQFAGRELSRGYLAFNVEIDQPGAYLLIASGHSAAIVNGQPRSGNPYGSWYQVPVLLRAGNNQLLFTVGRGRFQGSLTKLDKRVLLADGDATLPDWLRGTTEPLWAALPLINATQQTQTSLTIETQVGKASPLRTPVGPILPVALRKVGFQIQAEASPATDELDVQLRVLDAQQQVLDERTIQVAVRDPGDKHRRTFHSDIDGSVQYFGVVPPAVAEDQTADGSQDSDRPALVVTLHGASVEGMGQANVYQPKPNMFIVAPTNRRPFGFDWEDWGRRDAIEVLDIAQQEFDTDPRRTYLTGHSMGGHGTWQVGATFPDRFAAIGPSAGWVSFWSYGGPRSDSEQPLEQILNRATNGSDTLLMRDNYRQQGVYVLHGDADDNVPVSEARSMRKVLGEFHSDFVYYERPGAGHWWGNQCCDWPPMFEFFRRHQRPAADEGSSIDFTTVNPGVSARYDWVTILDQTIPLAASQVRLRWDRDGKRWQGTTNNVARLALDLAATPRADTDENAGTDEAAPTEVTVELDGQTLTLGRQRNYLARTTANTDDLTGNKLVWRVTEPPSRRDKGPHRYGLFKSAFDHNAVLVYGTAGTAEENHWSLAKARFDAEQFWYRGNGSFDVIPDAEFSPAEFIDRSVILYGNADTNSAWRGLLAECPVQMTRTYLTVGQRRWDDGQLFMLLAYPRPDSETALVGVVGGTGIAGARSTNLLRYFVSGVAYPNLLIGQGSFLVEKQRAILAAGFFDSQWSLKAADLIFADR